MDDVYQKVHRKWDSGRGLALSLASDDLSNSLDGPAGSRQRGAILTWVVYAVGRIVGPKLFQECICAGVMTLPEKSMAIIRVLLRSPRL